MDVERQHDVPAHRHRRVGNEPVPPDLRDEAAEPGPELDALRIELDRRGEVLIRATLGIRELILLRVLCTLRIASAITPATGPRGVCLSAARGRSRRESLAASAPVESLVPVVGGVGCGAGSGVAPARLRRAMASIRSGELPRENGNGFLGFGARSVVLARRSSRTDRRAAVACGLACPRAAGRRQTAPLHAPARVPAAQLLDRLLALGLERTHEGSFGAMRITMIAIRCRLRVDEHHFALDIGEPMVGVSGRLSSKSKYISGLSSISGFEAEKDDAHFFRIGQTFN